MKPVHNTRYEIAVRGHLGRALTVLFEGMEIRSSTASETHLIGDFQDQAALQGFLAQLGELGLELAGVRQVNAGPPDAPSGT